MIELYWRLKVEQQKEKPLIWMILSSISMYAYLAGSVFLLVYENLFLVECFPRFFLLLLISASCILVYFCQVCTFGSI